MSGSAPPTPAGGLTRADRRLAGDSLREDLTRENFYFVMADRFENGKTDQRQGRHRGDPAQPRLRPDEPGLLPRWRPRGHHRPARLHRGPRHDRDLDDARRSRTSRCRASRARESAGYHGYWITDFTQIDPHLGTNAELKKLIDLAHKRGIKVFFDIITNHTADVLDYPASAYDANGQVPYRTKEDAPYKDAAGEPVRRPGLHDDRRRRSRPSTRRSPSPTCRRSAPRPTRRPRCRPG